MASSKPSGRSRKERFAGIPHNVMDSENYARLSCPAIRLLLELARQFNGHNNGDLSAPISTMKKRGWKSSATLNEAKQCLEKLGFIQLTRQGGRNQCNLYALTWQPIDECKGKLEVKSTTKPSNLWQQPVGN